MSSATGSNSTSRARSFDRIRTALPMVFAVLLMWAELSVALMAPSSATDTAGRIGFRRSLTGALVDAESSGRQVAVYFSSPDCGWCRRLESVTLYDDAVVAAGKRYIWVRPPEEQKPLLAAHLQVMGVPTVVLLDSQGREIDRRSGYVAPAEFATFLRQAPTDAKQETSVDDALQAWKQAIAGDGTAGQPATAMRQLVEVLSRSDAADRRRILSAMDGAPRPARLVLCDLMDSEELAIRAAAHGALARIEKRSLPFDPFGPAEVRETQVRAWRDQLTAAPVDVREGGAVPASQPVSTTQPSQEATP